MTTEAAISIDDVWLAYPASVKTAPRIVLKNISISIEPNQCIAIVGASGIGKTSLLKVISGLLEPVHGSVTLFGNVPPWQALEERYFAWMFQEPTLFGWKTALENVALAGAILDDPSARENALKMIELVGLERFKDYYPHQLSGGMRSRVALARALAYRPRLLLLDEPFGALDELTREGLSLHIQNLTSYQPVTTILVTHSVPEAISLADRVIVLAGYPATIQAVVDIPLPRPRDGRSRNSPDFLLLAQRIRQHLTEISDRDAA